MEFVTDS